MTLAAGSRLGAYEIVALIGSGGMGEVYRARDSRLNRDVAIKVLPCEVSADPDRLARFEREAQVLASLNHPNIAQIHGVDDSPGTPALVMELVEGPTLADRIAKGPIALDEALPIAKQIAGALSAAHEQGIIHRDLKPANIKVRSDGTAKVLDFGLARMPVPSAAALSHSPTIIGVTGTGTLLGTAGYMSPEQARGQVVDKRTDVWAFGCVLYEMLAGRRAFDAGNASDTIAAILRGEPDWSLISVDVPPAIQTLLRRSLEKDRSLRIADISTAYFLVTEPLLGAVGPLDRPSAGASESLWQRLSLFAALALIVGIAISSGLWWRAKRTSPAGIARFVIPVAGGQRFTNLGRQIVTISPDGRQIVYGANEQLYLRSTDSLDAKPIPGTASAGGVNNPVFSPDGRWLAFYSLADKSIKRIAVTGGAAISLTAADNPFGMSWGSDEVLYGQGGFGQWGKGIMRVPARGGKPDVVVRVAADEVPYGPQILPNRDWLLLSVATTGNDLDRWNRARIIACSLKSDQRKVLIEGGSDAHYLSTGHLLYAREGTVFAVPFDADRLEVRGEPVPVVEGVRRSSGGQTAATQFAISETGTLMYLPGPASTSAPRDLAFVDRSGHIEVLRMPAAYYDFPRVSPKGGRVAMSTDDGKDAVVWIYDLASPRSPRRLTFGGRNRFPIWSTHDDRVAYQSDRDGNSGIWWQRADGTGSAERLTDAQGGTSHVPESWSRDEEHLLYSAIKGPNVSVWLFSLRNKTSTLFGELQTATSRPFNPTFSPDGQWVAYQSYESGSVNVYVQPFPATGAKYQIATVAWAPLWSPDSKELFYSTSNQITGVRLTTQPTFTVGEVILVAPSSAFAANAAYAPRSHDITPDGKRFIAVMDADPSLANPATEIRVALNWSEELKRLVHAP